MMLERVKIGTVCCVVSGSTPSRIVDKYWGGNIDWVTPKDINKLSSKYINKAPEKITEVGYKSCSTTLIPPKSLLLSSRAPIGLLAINTVPVCTNQGFKNLILQEDKVDVVYLYYCLGFNKNKLQSLGTGSTFKEISKKMVENFQIPLPPLETQKKIAEILDTADTLRQKDKALIEKYNQLTQSLFLEMFGDPVRNEKGWEKKKLEALATLMSGGTPSRLQPEYFEGNIPWVTTVALGKKFIKKDDAVAYLTEEAVKNSATKLIPQGSIMIGTRVGVGKVSILDCDMCGSQDILSLVNLSEIINKIFLVATFSYFMKFFESQKRGATIQGITSQVIKNLDITIPPIELQNKFASMVEEIEKQKQLAEENQKKSEALFNSLLQKAFKGELVKEEVGV